jgi:hypothetical protein
MVAQTTELRRVNFMMDSDSIDYVQSKLGSQTLSAISRKLLILFANNPELRAQVCALDADNQARYEKLQQIQ